MKVAIKQSEWQTLTQNEKRFIRQALRRLDFGVPARWKDPDTNERWRVYSDSRISTFDVALVARLFARRNLVPADYMEEGDRTKKQWRKVRNRKLDKLANRVKDYPTGVKRTKTVNVVTWEPVIVGYEQVSRGMFCIASDAEGNCTEWEERFKQVPIYEMKNLRDADGNLVKDEDGKNVKVPKIERVVTPTEVDVYYDANDAIKRQGTAEYAVEEFIRAGDLGNLVPIEENDI